MENLGGVLAMMLAFATPFARFWRRRWGATPEEVGGVQPGDELVPAPKWMANHAIAIDAPPDRVWPWIAQIGQGRGGFYSYERLENLTGCQITNTSRILAEHQDLRPGDPIRLHAEVPPMSAAIVAKPTALVLHGSPSGEDGPSLSSTWAFLLFEQPDGTTRLLSRTRYDYAGDLRSRLMGGPLLIEPISFVMERKMLRVIRALVEAEARGVELAGAEPA